MPGIPMEPLRHESMIRWADFGMSRWIYRLLYHALWTPGCGDSGRGEVQWLRRFVSSWPSERADATDHPTSGKLGPRWYVSSIGIVFQAALRVASGFTSWAAR